MSKNTASTAFRKLDVDALNEDAYHDDEEPPETPGMGPDENEVNQFLSGNQNVDALKSALKNAPLRTRHQATKDRATQLMLRVLTTFKQQDIEKAIKTLDNDEIIMLLKYVYKGFEFPQDSSSAQLLNWHAKIVDRTGTGGIVRVLTDNMKRL